MHVLHATTLPIVSRWLNDSSSSYMALQPISGLGILFMMFRNLTLIDGW
jgi:hypothetical protein